MKVTIFGNLGKDPEMAYTQSGVAVAKFSIAENRKGKDGDPVTDWWNCTAFRKTAEVIASNTRKGSRLLVFGTATMDYYVDRDGNKRSAVQVNVDDVRFADARPDGEQRQEHSQQSGVPF